MCLLILPVTLSSPQDYELISIIYPNFIEERTEAQMG